MNNVPKLKAMPKAVEYHFDLIGPIEEYDEYLELIDALREATENDEVHIHINTPGGDLSIVAQILHNIEACNGTVVTHAEGEVSSGGSIIFFKGDQLIVGPYAEFLAHGPHGGRGGKVQDQVDGAKHTAAYVKELYHDVYGDFYSVTEINRILKGKEHYETAKEVMSRLEKARVKIMKEYNEMVEENLVG